MANVRIYTLAGEFVRVLQHDRDQYGNATSTLGWDLKNERGETVTSGVYIYQVKSPSGEVVQGYFALVL